MVKERKKLKFSQDEKNLYIGFSEYLGIDDPDGMLNKFDMTSRITFKAFHNNEEVEQNFLRTYEEIFNNFLVDKPEHITEFLVMQLYSFKLQYEDLFLSDTSTKNQILKNFIKLLEPIVGLKRIPGSANLGDVINAYVNTYYKKYSDNADAIVEKAKKKGVADTELVFKDMHAKFFYRIAYIQRLLIPFISDFFNKYKKVLKEEDDDDDEAQSRPDSPLSTDLYKILESLNKFHIGVRYRLLENKLLKKIDSEITLYEKNNDKGYLGLINIQGINRESVTVGTMYTLNQRVLFKILLEKNENKKNTALGLIFKVIKGQIILNFTKKIDANTHVYLGVIQNDSEAAVGEGDHIGDEDVDFTDFSNHSSKYFRDDDGEYLLRRKSINTLIKFLYKHWNIEELTGKSLREISEAEYPEEYTTQIYERVLRLIIFNFYTDTNFISICSLQEYKILVYFSILFIEKNKLSVLHEALSNLQINQRLDIGQSNEITSRNKIRIFTKYAETKWDSLLRVKFNFTKDEEDEIKKQNIIKNIVSIVEIIKSREEVINIIYEGKEQKILAEDALIEDICKLVCLVN